MTPVATARRYLQAQVSQYEGTVWATVAAQALRPAGLRASDRVSPEVAQMRRALDLVSRDHYGLVAVAERMQLASDAALLERVRELRVAARQKGDQKLFLTADRAITRRSVAALRECARVLRQHQGDDARSEHAKACGWCALFWPRECRFAPSPARMTADGHRVVIPNRTIEEEEERLPWTPWA